MKNSCTKWKSRGNFLDLKKSKQICTNLTKQAKRNYFKKASNKNNSTRKRFWKSRSPFDTEVAKMINNDFKLTANLPKFQGVLKIQYKTCIQHFKEDLSIKENENY